MKEKEKIYFVNDGCDKVYVFRQIAECAKEKYTVTKDISEADVIIHFTCGFTKHDPYFFISSLSLVYDTRKADSKVIITGCGIKMYEEKIFERMKKKRKYNCY